MTSPTISSDRMALTVIEAARLTAISRASIYAELAAGRLKGRKLGRRTLVEVASLRDWFASLPPYESTPAA